MEPHNSSIWYRIWRAIRIPVVVVAILYLALVIYRIPAMLEQQKTEEIVAKIHAQRLTLKDVAGENLPPEPDPALKDATVEGIDANANGIRDDVELAIFKEYPNSAKTRAVLLQYAMALQMEATQAFVNSGVVGAVAEQKSRGYLCIGEITSRDDMRKFIEVGDKLHSFVETRQLNSDSRQKTREEFYKFLKSGEVPNDYCDLDLSTLPN